MGKDLVAYLPPEIIINILMRLPFRSIMRFRCVCKLWLSLTEAHEFIKFYFQKSSFPGGLALFRDETSSKSLKILEFVDKGNSAHPCRIVLSISFPTPHRDLIIQSSVNGLLFLFNRNKSPHFVCNPITREYIELPPPIGTSFTVDTFGFGASKLTGQYKVVRLFRKGYLSPFKCEVYTVGTGSWRSIAADNVITYSSIISKGVFCNGNLHWLARLSRPGILCFDLETERFTIFSSPLHGYYDKCRSSLCALGDCLYLCQNSYDVVIWLMNEYGNHKSWRKECVIKMQRHDTLYACIVPIKIFRDGDILFAYEYSSPKLYCYSSKTKTIREITCRICSGLVGYTPSLLPLKTFVMENVSSF